MRGLVKILFIFVLLSWGAAGLRHAQGHHGDEPGFVRANASASASLPSEIKWLADQAVTWAKDYEMEE